MKDLGVTFEANMTFKIHISEKINKANQMLGIIKINFKNIDKFTFRTLYTGLVRSQLEYAHAVWNPYKISLITDLEKVQKRATKLIKSLKRLPYKDRLIHLGLPTLKYRRLRGDMIEVYKILNDQYDSAVCPTLTRNFDTRTRGNSLKLQLDHCKTNTRKFSFSVRVIKIWNSLPNTAVTASSLNGFKNRLDAFWKDEDVLYDWEADLSLS